MISLQNLEHEEEDSALQKHPEMSTREGIMSERFLCGPEMARSAANPRFGITSRFADSASQGGVAPQLHPHVPMQQGFSPGSSMDAPEGSSLRSFSELTAEEQKELEEVRCCSLLVSSTDHCRDQPVGPKDG